MAVTPDRPRLIINADDFGYSEGVTRGIAEAHAAGVVTSTSILANGIDFENAVHLARTYRALGVGVHLNLVQGRSLIRVPSLTDPATNEFYPLATQALRAMTGRIDARELDSECRAQIARVREAGLTITHLDSHRHAHAMPGIFPVVSRVAREAGIRAIRIPREPLRMRAFDGVATVRKLVLGLSLRAVRALPLRAPLVTTDHFRGISLQGGSHFAGRVRRVLDTLGAGSTELMVHPGHVDASLAAQDSYTAPRSIELAELLSAGVRDRLGRGDIELITFADL